MAFNSSIFDSTSTTEQSTTTQNAGFSEVSGSALSLNLTGGGKKSNQDIVVNALDGGAILNAFKFADALGSNAFKFADEMGTNALKQVEFANNNARSTVSEAVNAVKESARSETENVMISGAKWAVIGVAVVAGFWAIGKIWGR